MRRRLSCTPHQLSTPAAATAMMVVLGGVIVSGGCNPDPSRTAGEWLALAAAPSDTVAVEDRLAPFEVGPAGGDPELVVLPTAALERGAATAAEWCAMAAAADWVVVAAEDVRRPARDPSVEVAEISRLQELLTDGGAGLVPLTAVEGGWLRPGSGNQPLLLLRRVAEVGAAELERRAAVLRRPDAGVPRSGAPRPRGDPLPVVEPLPDAMRQLRDAVAWAAVLLVLGLGCWTVILPLTASQTDAGLGLALVTGWMAPAWLMWLGSELGLWRVGETGARVLVVVLAVSASVVALRRRAAVADAWRARRQGMALVLAAALAVAVFFAVVRALNPAIAGGEKPMDYSFLNAFAGADAWPTGEPWMAGRPLHYYYFGQVLTAFPILVAGCRTAVGYNLAAATVPALAAALLTAVGLGLARSRGGALLIPLLVLLSGNLAWPKLLGTLRSEGLFELWWATSRVNPSPYAIEEFPLWTALFADLHGHFIALPVLLAALAWGALAVAADRRRWLFAAALCGLATGILGATNPWDLLVLVAALGLGVAAAAPRPLVGLLRLLAAAAFSVAAVAPFLVELAVGVRAGAGGGIFATTGDFAPWWAVALHFGLFLLPLAALAAVRAGRLVWPGLAAAVAGVAAGLALGSSAAALALGCAGLVAAALAGTVDLDRRLGWTFALLGALLTAGCERFTVIDRMNTVFKVYNGVWLLLALALGILLLRETGGGRRLLLVLWVPLELVALVNLPLGVAAAVADPLVPSPRPTLDGQAYLRRDRPDDWFLARTVEAVAAPGEVVAEAAGEGYSRAARVVMHTGRPTVVGWPWHLQQRGQPKSEIVARQRALAELYRGADPASRRAVLDRYRVRWVALGNLERRTYGLWDPDPLAAVPGVVRIAVNGRSAVYLVQ